MTLDEARADLEARFPPHAMVGNYAHCATGEPYIEMLSCGIHVETFPTSASFFASEEEAINGWVDGVNLYAKDKTGVLYWRVPPVIEKWNGKWQVYSRLIISDKPPIQLQCTIRGSL